jgi:hypothetical protein
MDRLCAFGPLLRANRRRRIMLDIAFIIVGALLIAAMGVYADACRRL